MSMRPLRTDRGSRCRRMTSPVIVSNRSLDVPPVCHRPARQAAVTGQVFGAVVGRAAGPVAGPAPSPGCGSPVRGGPADHRLGCGSRRTLVCGDRAVEWARGAPQRMLARLRARLPTSPNVWIAPSGSTVRRIVSTVCPGGLADLTGEAPAGAESVAADGKGASGSRHGRTPAGHLLAAMTDDGRTVTQFRVPDKTNELTCFAALPEPLGLADRLGCSGESGRTPSPPRSAPPCCTDASVIAAARRWPGTAREGRTGRCGASRRRRASTAARRQSTGPWGKAGMRRRPSPPSPPCCPRRGPGPGKSSVTWPGHALSSTPSTTPGLGPCVLNSTGDPPPSPLPPHASATRFRKTRTPPGRAAARWGRAWRRRRRPAVSPPSAPGAAPVGRRRRRPLPAEYGEVGHAGGPVA